MDKHDEIARRLQRLGKTRRWLAEQSAMKKAGHKGEGYSYFSIRDALSGAKPPSPKMVETLEEILAAAEAQLPPENGDILGCFDLAERKSIMSAAERDGYAGQPHAWIVEVVRWVLKRPQKRLQGKQSKPSARK